jgi:hypothetical protein
MYDIFIMCFVLSEILSLEEEEEEGEGEEGWFYTIEPVFKGIISV